MSSRQTPSDIAWELASKLRQADELTSKLASLRVEIDDLATSLRPLLPIDGAITFLAGRSYDPSVVRVRHFAESDRVTAILLPVVHQSELAWPDSAEPPHPVNPNVQPLDTEAVLAAAFDPTEARL